DKRKTTTKQQFEVLALLIEKNSGIAGDRDKGTNKFWQEVTTTLNELGPPTKDALGWKKVWADYKAALKKKLAHNKNEYRSTGGGPCSMRSFNALEQKIIEVLDLQRSIVGTPNVPALGVVLPEENQSMIGSQPATGLQNESTEPEEQGESQITKQVVAEVETRPGPSQVIPNERRGKKRTVAEQHLLELRKFNAIQQRLLLLKTEKQ
uniref:Regulatory protein zeste n=1 Tax=Anopheles funestus TaxID=62324 RepID=A0A182S087_ANOFN